MEISATKTLAMVNGLIDNEGYAVCVETANYEYYFEGGNSENMDAIVRYKKGSMSGTYFAENNDHRQKPLSEFVLV